MKEFTKFSFKKFSFVNEANWIIIFSFLPLIIGIPVALLILITR